MNIKIIYDNNAEPGFMSGWGFSALIGNTTLFDMGENADSLLANMRAFNIDPKQIERVVLSHEDWDHVGGLSLLSQFGAVQVYVPCSFSKDIKRQIIDFNSEAEIVEISSALAVDPDLIVTEQLGTLKKEISLAVRFSQGIVLIVGCAHPGLDKIMAMVSGCGPLHAVIGGFHGFRKLKVLANVSLIVPTHCTRKTQQIVSMYPQQTRIVAAGSEIDIKDEL